MTSIALQCIVGRMQNKCATLRRHFKSKKFGFINFVRIHFGKIYFRKMSEIALSGCSLREVDCLPRFLSLLLFMITTSLGGCFSGTKV